MPSAMDRNTDHNNDILNTIQEKWNDILFYLKNEYEISDVSFKTWILPLEVAAVDDQTIIVVVPEENIGLNYIKKKYYLPLKVSVSEIMGQDYEILFILPDDFDRDFSLCVPERRWHFDRANRLLKTIT